MSTESPVQRVEVAISEEMQVALDQLLAILEDMEARITKLEEKAHEHIV